MKEFDYVALGASSRGTVRQQAKDPVLRYAFESIRSVRARRIKSLTVVTLKAKGEKPEIENYPLHPLRDVRKKKEHWKKL